MRGNCSSALKAFGRLHKADGAPADHEIYITLTLLYSDMGKAQKIQKDLVHRERMPDSE